MNLFLAFATAFGKLAKLPLDVAQALLTHYILVIYFGGLIFFILNTPSGMLTKVLDSFIAGDFPGTIQGIVDASIAFAENVKGKFNPDTLSATIQDSLCKIMKFAKLRDDC